MCWFKIYIQIFNFWILKNWIFRIIIYLIYFIKKYYPVKLKEILKNIISFKSPFNSAVGEYNATLAVEQQKIKTLDIAGYGIKKNLLSSTSFIITKAIEPNISVDQLLEKYLNHRDYFKLKRSLINS